MKTVYIEKCGSYNPDEVRKSIKTLCEKCGVYDIVKSGMTVGIKANLVSFIKPEGAATTHPEALLALAEIIVGLGAKVVIGDSPGGLYTPAFVEKVYSVTGLKAIENENIVLNRNFEQKNATFPEAKVLTDFQYTSWLDDCDLLINFCKLKSHGMMGMSAGAKNMFGVIPGTVKPEYHFRFPNHEDFARMIVDLNDYFRPVLTFCDGVVGMEGNGPTAGTPREIGLLLAGECPHSLDLVCAHIIGLEPKKVPTLWAAEERGYISLDDEEAKFLAQEVRITDYKNIETAGSILFAGHGSILGRVRGDVLKFLLSSKPHLKPKECVGCKECFKICPAKAITMVKGKPKIDRKKCIKCFCCQEFCPKGALKVKRPAIAKLLNK